MVARRLSDEDFVRAFESVGARAMADQYNISERVLYRRRRAIEERIHRKLLAPSEPDPQKALGRIAVPLENGTVLIGGDFHIWPGVESPMQRFFLHLCKELRPNVVIANGDVLDFPRISRFPLGWKKFPKVNEELEAAQDYLHKIELAVSRRTRLIWPEGNHDERFERSLAAAAPEYQGVQGVHLKDHFPRWEPCWSVFINDDVVVKHRYKGGIHAAYNNALRSGRTTITGHLHSAMVRPITDYNGTRFGIDAGMIADPDGPQFNYLQDDPRDWRMACCVLTIWKGRLQLPELAMMVDKKHVQFGGKVTPV